MCSSLPSFCAMALQCGRAGQPSWCARNRGAGARSGSGRDPCPAGPGEPRWAAGERRGGPEPRTPAGWLRSHRGTGLARGNGAGGRITHRVIAGVRSDTLLHEGPCHCPAAAAGSSSTRSFPGRRAREPPGARRAGSLNAFYTQLIFHLAAPVPCRGNSSLHALCESQLHTPSCHSHC